MTTEKVKLKNALFKQRTLKNDVERLLNTGQSDGTRGNSFTQREDRFRQDTMNNGFAKLQ